MTDQNEEVLNAIENMVSTQETQADEIIVIVDRSGSMTRIRDDAEGGVNTFITEQQKLPGQANFTLVEFDSTVEKLQDREALQYAEPYKLVPRGSTALYDAIGLTLNEFRDIDMGQDVNPVVVIVTDGHENASREYSQSDVFGLITEFREKGWEFLFLAAGQDAMAAGTNIGVNADDILSFSASASGIKGAYDGAVAYTTSVRSKSKADFYAQKQELQQQMLDDE